MLHTTANAVTKLSVRTHMDHAGHKTTRGCQLTQHLSHNCNCMHGTHKTCDVCVCVRVHAHVYVDTYTSYVSVGLCAVTSPLRSSALGIRADTLEYIGAAASRTAARAGFFIGT